MNTLPPPRPDFDQPDTPVLRHKRPVWWWPLLIVIIVLAGWYVWKRTHAPAAGDATAVAGAPGAGGPGGAGRGKRNQAPTVMPVGVAAARTADVNVYLSGLGGVTATATATVKARVDGPLLKINFKEGQIVKAGDVLAEIDPAPYKILVAQAEGTLARDRALLSSAQIDLKRYQTLLSQDSIASQQVDTQAALVKQYEGTAKTDQAAVDNARLNLSYTRVTAPISGRLGLKQVDVGNIIHASDTTGIVIITQVQPITTVFSIPEDNIPAVMKQLQAGHQLAADAWDRALKNRLASGFLVTIDNAVDATTGTVKLKAQFPNTDYALFPNQFVNIKLLLEIRRNSTVIPSAAVQRGTKGMFVYVVKADNTVTVRAVKPGIVQGDLTAIDDGIAVGETVVIDGIDKLREGAKVAPVARGGANDPAAKLSQEKAGGRRRKRDGADGAAAAQPGAPAAATAGTTPGATAPASGAAATATGDNNHNAADGSGRKQWAGKTDGDGASGDRPHRRRDGAGGSGNADNSSAAGATAPGGAGTQGNTGNRN